MNDMNNFILRAENIHKSFTKIDKQRLEVLKGVSISIEKSKVSMIIGASGAGKSTLLHIISGLDNADEGKVYIDKTDIFSLNDDHLSKFRNKYIGFVFQFHHLLPEFDALENVALPMLVARESQSKAKKHAAELLDLVGLKNRMTHKPSELSGGEAQRVAVARALVNNPQIIFADEPTGNLDSRNSDLLHQLILDIRDKFGITFLIVTHNPELIKLGEKIFEMKDGIIHNSDNSMQKKNNQ
jgi:lipoprotein-releasing system ATP-binding protein